MKVPKVVLFTTTGSLDRDRERHGDDQRHHADDHRRQARPDQGRRQLKGRQFTGTFTGTSDLAKNLITFKYKGLLPVPNPSLTAGGSRVSAEPPPLGSPVARR